MKLVFERRIVMVLWMGIGAKTQAMVEDGNVEVVEREEEEVEVEEVNDIV